MVSKIWQFLTTDVRELNWKQATEATKTAADTGKAVLDLAKTVNEKKGDLGQVQSAIAPYVGEMSSLLDVLNSPIASVVKDAIPFAPIAVTILQLICEATKQEPKLEQCVALMSQAAYLESLRDLFKTGNGGHLLGRLQEKPVAEHVRQRIRKLGELGLDRSGANLVITDFAGTELAKAFNEALVARLVDGGIGEAEAKIWAERVAWNTPKFFNEAIAEAKDKVKVLAEIFSNGGRETLEHYSSIERYLREKIQPLPQELVFDEIDLRFVDIYVALRAQPLTQGGRKDDEQNPVQLEERVLELLTNDRQDKQIIFIQGEAGQGKSVFCRMFGDRVRREIFPSFTPILIRLRNLKTLATNLTTTLGTYLEHLDFVQSDGGWLTDRNQRFLFLLDGFDELLLQGGVKSGETGGLKEFLGQVVSFQKDSHHRFIITGRPLSLQGIDRLISQSKNLARLALCSMQNDVRTLWLDKWAEKFGTTERDSFTAFLEDCPEDVNDKLAREPLLLYLLARMHRDRAISAAELQGTSGLRSKIKIYNTVIDWVLERQRGDENSRITGLECVELRQLLTEAALCVVQSGNETAQVKMLEMRLAKDTNNPIAAFIEKSRQAVDVNEQKALNNLLTTFYIKPAAVDQEGSIEFAHKSFGEFLFAERLKEAIEDWSKPGDRRRGKYLVPDDQLHWEIYDLLGFGGLTQEITNYLTVMLEDGQEWQPVILFERLNDFWERWCDGEFIDAPPENLPQRKMRLLREQMPDQEAKLGLRQVDVYTGLNILILLLGLHRYAQNQDGLKDKIHFYPSSYSINHPLTSRLLQIFYYSDSLKIGNFHSTVGFAMNSADLSHAYLSCANLGSACLRHACLRHAYLGCAYLGCADLSGADLSGADLSSADLRYANLSDADLSSADLRSTDLSSANLSDANLSDVNLEDIRWNQLTDWTEVRGLETAHNVPELLKQQLGLA
jgi:Pentapeptide repeats (8 copies)/NACHT domain